MSRVAENASSEEEASLSSDYLLSLDAFLSYDPATKTKKELQNALLHYHFLLTIAKEAIFHFNNKHLERFDSLVGENACQIRALRLSLIVKHNRVDFAELENRVEKALQIVDYLLQPKIINILMQCQIAFSEVLAKENLFIPLTIDESFLVQAFILTETKEVNEMNFQDIVRDEITNPKKLKKFGSISATFTYDFVRKMRKHHSIDSVNFIRKSASELLDFHIARMCSSEFTFKHFGCQCIPMFWAYRTMLTLLIRNEIPILIHNKFYQKKEASYAIQKEIFLWFYPKDGKYFLIEKPPQNSPSIIFQGITVCEPDLPINPDQWMKQFCSISLEEVILAGAADHRQYPNSEFDQNLSNTNDEHFQYYKRLANQNGFAESNPSLFFIQHVYASSQFQFLSS